MSKRGASQSGPVPTHVPASDRPSARRRWAASACVLGMLVAGCHPKPATPESSATEASNEAVSAEKPGGTNGAAAQSPALAADVALIQAIEHGNLRSVQRLVEQGANPDATDKVLARTPLHTAAYFDREKIADLLIAKGANVNTKDSTGLAPLHAAVLGGGKRIVAHLLAKGADVNAATDAGITPLHMAAAAGEYELTKLLLRAGAAASRLDKSGHPPRYYAMRNGHEQTAGLLPETGKSG